MMNTSEITRVTYRWDAPAGVEPGWYAEAWAGDRVSEKFRKSEKLFPLQSV